jgi:diguanylate cyclase (GGDEF)-like protein
VFKPDGLRLDTRVVKRVRTGVGRGGAVPPRSPMMALTVGGYVLGGMAAFAARSLYRPEGRPWVALLGVALLIFGVSLGLWGRRGFGVVVLQALLGLAAVGVCGFYASEGRITLAVAAVLGAALVDPAMHLSRRVVLALTIAAVFEDLALITRSGVTGPALMLITLLMTIACLAPTVIVLIYRRQLDGMVAQLRDAATTDTLTALASRRGLADRSPMLFSEAERSGGSVAVLLADIDHFKLYNDTHGHLRGDDVLRTVARLLRQSVRPADVVARLGGEELCIVTVLSDPADAPGLAERVRATVEQGSGAVTVSLGVVTGLPQGGLRVDDQLWGMIDAADALMYEAKQAGRNTARIQIRPTNESLLGPPATV